ncbi:hypothetical protein ACFE04_024310 [Oxalis oulophora]
MAAGGGEYSDQSQLLRSDHINSDNNVHKEEEDEDEDEEEIMEAQSSRSTNSNSPFKDMIKRLDRKFSNSSRRHHNRRIRRSNTNTNTSTSTSTSGNDRRRHDSFSQDDDDNDDVLGDSAPPEWALLLIGCLLGLATGLCVAAFNKGVHLIHEWAWAGTPHEGASWLRIQRLADTWHRILLIPVMGGVIVGMMHGLLEILDQIRQSISSSQQQAFDPVSGVFPTIKAIQAAITLGTGCSLGPEGPSVDIGKACARGFSVMMENNRERRIALVAAGAAAGISSGFNAAVAGCFFAIETVLRALRAENSPPFTTAMIILASVISSTVSTALLGTQSAFTVPAYDLKSAAELPLYLILGMLCGVVSVIFTHLVTWFTKSFDFIRERFGIPAVVCPALGGLGAGIIALRYPGILYWGFTNVEEILHTGKSAAAPGMWLLTQLAAAKVVATALCKGSGLVGGLYAPSLMIGAAVGAVFGNLASDIINSAIPGNNAVAQPQAYALVGMAATLASVCSVPLTSVLLMFELTKDYRILLPLMGAVGLAIWVPSVTNQSKENDQSDGLSPVKGYSSLSPREDNDIGDDLELAVIEGDDSQEAVVEEVLLEKLKVSRAMSKKYVKVSLSATLKEVINRMEDTKQSCVFVVDVEDFLEGILTYGDIRRCLSKKPTSNGDSAIVDVNTCIVSSVCTRGITYRGQERGLLTCYPDTNLAIAKELMEAKGIKQLPVVKHGGDLQKERKRRIVAILHYDSVWNCVREEMNRQKSLHQSRKENNRLEEIIVNGR